MNKVRMFLGVVTLSDITVADVKSIDKDILSGTRRGSNPTPSRNAYRWPYIPQPTLSDRQLEKHHPAPLRHYREQSHFKK